MKAIALYSGGLDSSLAAKIILDQGIKVAVVKYLNPFGQGKISDAERTVKQFANNLDTEFKLVSLVDECLGMIRKPRFGFGSNLNPCIDCRILMLKRTKQLMGEIGASFVITGEVLGQRPMSQYRKALKLVEEESGLNGLILRPLSAKLLDPTIPEQKGWVDREKLYDFSGRGRKSQIALAKEFGIEEYKTPAGGCLLADSGFSKRLKDLLENSANKALCLNDIELLKLGRHFRLGPGNKLIVGRDEKENNELLKLATSTDYIFEPVEIAGPIAIGRGDFKTSDVFGLASQIISRYCDASEGQTIKINLTKKDSSPKDTQDILSSAIDQKYLEKLRI